MKGGSVTPIAILVAQTKQDILAESIAEGIKRSIDVDLACERVILIHELFALLSESKNPPNIVILVGSDKELAEYSNELLASYPYIVVARIVVGSELVHIDLRQVDLQELILSVCGLFRRHAASSEQRSTQYKLVPNHFATAKGDVRMGLVEIKRQHTVLGKAMVWLDALLRLQLERTSGPGNDLPGLSVSRITIESLLQCDSSEINANLEEQQHSVDSAGNELILAIKEAQSSEEPLAALCKGLELSSVETQAFVLCLAPELDSKYERIFGFIHDNLAQKNATLGLIALLLDEALQTRIALANSSLFKRWRLLGTQGDCFPHGDEPLRVDPDLISWIFGNRSAILHDAELAGLVIPKPWAGADWLEDLVDVQFAHTLKKILGSDHNRPYWVVLEGNDASVWRAILENSAGELETPLLRISLAALDGLDANAIDQYLVRLGWAVRLTGAIPAIDAYDMASSSASIRTVKRVVDIFNDTKRTCVFIVRDIIHVLDALPGDDYQLCQRNTLPNSPPVTAFVKASAESGLSLANTNSELLASAYPLPLDGIGRAVRLAVARGANARQSVGQQAKLLADACREVACPQLPRFATLLEPSFRLDEVVLPSSQRRQLDDIVSHVLHARKVLNHWGFDAQLPYGKGIAALFTGPSGTGKTMAARAIAHALQRSVFAVDLSKVVSKYIGETEKNLDMVFLEAERAGAILLFDEADALFGKRSEVKDAHDRYANIETAYLLQRMEAFSGVAILTSNIGQSLDQSFLRRLRVSIVFPFPDASAREKIWRQCLPPEAPLAEDLDLGFLAHRVEITGGDIRVITLNAAFAAAAEGESVPISLSHILRATHAEALKLGMPRLARELAEQAA
jgi:hypothetical protein